MYKILSLLFKIISLFYIMAVPMTLFDRDNPIRPYVHIE